jgi:FkbM family methyltransferase
VNGSFDFDKVEKAIAIIRNQNNQFRLETLIDVGANIGTVCIPAIKRGFADRAIAIEPEPLNYRVLVANIYLNDLADKIIAHNLAFGREDNQILELELSSSNSGDHRIRINGDSGIHSKTMRSTVAVKSETFDKIIPVTDKNSCIVWIDTQGYEGIILQGAQNAVRAQIPMVIEFWPYGMKHAGSFAALKSAIMSYGKYYDLAGENECPVKITESTIDDLYHRLSEADSWTDILVL